MPYQLVTAKVRGTAISAVWEDADLSQRDINEVLRTYSRVILTLTHTVVSGTFYLNLEDARPQFGAYTGTKTVASWLASLGTASLPTMAQAPSFKEYPIKYSDAWRAGYKIELVDGTRHPEAQLPDRDKNDLLLTKKNVDFRVMGHYMLTTVNGFLHRSAGTEHGLVVLGGGRTGFLGNDSLVGVISFREVGALQVIPITPQMVYKQTDDQKLSQYAMIKSPIALDDKVVLMSIGGYLHVVDGAYEITGSKAIRINIDTLSYVDRIYESLGQIDLKSLGLQVGEDSENQFALDNLLSDSAITAYLSLSQSFMIVLPKSDLYVRRHSVEHTGLGGRYITDFPLKMLPLMATHGKIHDYAPFPQRGQTVLRCAPARRYARNFHTSVWPAEISVSGQNLPSAPFQWSDAYLLEIGRAA